MMIAKLILVSLIFCEFAYAVREIKFSDFGKPEVKTPAVSMASGNSDLNHYNGGESVFTNPASIPKIFGRSSRKPHRVSFEINSNTNANLFQEAYSGNFLGGPVKQLNFLNLTKVQDALIEDNGGVYFNEISANLFYKYKFLMIGTFYNNKSFGYLKDETSNFFGLKRKDAGAYIGFAGRIGKHIDFGLSNIYMNRRELYTVRDSSVPSVDVENEDSEGNMHLTTFAMRYRTARSYYRPGTLISLVGRNILDAKFKETGSADDSLEKIPTTIDFGISKTMDKWNRYQVSLTMRDISGNYDVKFSRKLQAGFRMKPSKGFSTSIGIFDLNPTFGFEVKVGNLGSALFTTYATSADIAEQEVVDRRYILQYSKVLGF